jgi:hypothetical protein
MKNTILGTLFALSLNAHADISGQVQFVLTPWIAECQAFTSGQPVSCGLPQASQQATPQTYDFTLAQVSQAGQAGQVTQNFVSGPVQGVAVIYSVYPPVSQNLPAYLQVRIELTSPVRAVCAQSVKWTGNGELPPLICAGFGSSTQEVGVTGQFYISAASPSI